MTLNSKDNSLNKAKSDLDDVNFLKIYGIRGVSDINLKVGDVVGYDSISSTSRLFTSLNEGVITKREVLCLLAEAHADFPDSRAAGNLLQKLDVILPGIKIDPKPLYKEAEKIENDIKKFIQQSKPTAPALPQIPTSMYG